jgi:TMEM175 potassium channel family protein
MSERRERPRVSGTARMETFSDGVMAIVVTLLVFDLSVPELHDPSSRQLWRELGDLTPKFVSFAISFFTVAIFWVNHHHFMHRVTHTDWKLLWLNNLLLFWLTTVPFTTGFLGDYPRESVAVGVYAFSLGMAALSFTLMGRYVFFGAELVEPSVPVAARRRERRRSWIGTGMYLAAAGLAFVWVYAALAIIVVIPFAYVVPNLLRSDADEGA